MGFLLQNIDVDRISKAVLHERGVLRLVVVFVEFEIINEERKREGKFKGDSDGGKNQNLGCSNLHLFRHQLSFFLIIL